MLWFSIEHFAKSFYNQRNHDFFFWGGGGSQTRHSTVTRTEQFKMTAVLGAGYLYNFNEVSVEFYNEVSVLKVFIVYSLRDLAILRQ
jgi:hypothetical protein